MKRLRAVMAKEFAHILRDPRSLTIVFVMPLLMIFIYGYAISFDLDRVATGVVDLCRTSASADLVKAFSSTTYFAVREIRPGDSSRQPLDLAERAIRSGRFREVVVIPSDFSQNLQEGRPAEVGVIIDGSDSNIASRLYQYNALLLQEFMLSRAGMRGLIKVSTKIYFNPETKSAYFFVPGLVAVLLLMIAAMQTSVSISRERERGSIDLLFISPLRAGEIIIGKTLPYVIVAFLTGTGILIFSHLWFGVPLRGNLLILAPYALLYVLTGLSFGILISTAAPSQRVAMIAALLTTLLPSVLLSGFIFPLESLGLVLRLIARLIPAGYFLRVIRGVVLKGAGLSAFVKDGLYLAGFSLFFLGLASARFARLRRSTR